MKKYLSTLSNFELIFVSVFTVLLSYTFALITGPTSNGPSFFENVYVLISMSIILIFIGGLYLGELLFRLRQYLRK